MFRVEKVPEDIQDLIVKAVDPKDKAMLIVLLKISESLRETTHVVKEMRDDFETHMENFAKHEKNEADLISGGRGVVRAAIVFLALLQGIIIWQVSRFVADIDETRDAVHQIKIELSRQDQVDKELLGRVK